MGQGRARNVICESDSAEAISLLQSAGDCSFHMYGALLHVDISKAVNRPWHLQFIHVMREANNCADFLAKSYSSSANEMEGLDGAPCTAGCSSPL